MPAHSPEALARKRLARKVREHNRRNQYKAQKQQAVTIKLDPLSSGAEGCPLRLLGQSQGIDPLRPNLTLTDVSNGQVIVQRLSPSTPDIHAKLIASSKEGERRHKAYLAKRDKKNRNNKPSAPQITTQRAIPEHHLGFWHSQGCHSLDLTHDTKGNAWREKGLELLAWAKTYADVALIGLEKEIDSSFAANLDGRLAGRQWLEAQFGDTVQLLHKWWTTVAFFSGFPIGQGLHTDDNDCSPSFLFNFGEPAYLQLPEFGVAVQVNPHDIVVLNSRRYLHQAASVVPGSTGSGRWAFSGMFRQHIYDRKPVSKVSAKQMLTLLKTS